jgi:predicted nucleic acid-binding protein
MSVQVDWDVSDDDKAKAEIAAAVKYLLKDKAGNARVETVQEIIDIVRDAAAGMLAPRDCLDPRAVTPPAMNGIIYKAYVIDAFQRDTDKWRATIRRLNGKKIRVAVPPSVLDEATTSADALTAEKAVELAKQAIDGGGLT